MSDDRTIHLAREWIGHRPRLVGVAYALLGTLAEAEDVVSECWFSLVAADERDPVRDVEAWATVAVARRALDVLRSARVSREAYVGPWLPEPVLSNLDAPTLDPADRVTLDDRVSYALMVVLETLTPAERTAWVLHELFNVPFSEVARIVGRSPAAVRQLAVRARHHIETGATRVEIAPAEHRKVAEAFLRAATGGDLDALLVVLDPDVILTSDGGGKVRAARRPVYGADRVARFIVGLSRKSGANTSVLAAEVNGGPGMLGFRNGAAFLIGAITVNQGRVSRIDLVVAPDKLP